MYWPIFLSLFFFSAGLNFCLAVSCTRNCYSTSTLSGNFPPVFVGFAKNGSLDTSKVEDYARLLCKIKVDGVVVNSIQAGGQILTLAEKKIEFDAWIKASKICNLTVVCKLGPMNYQETIELAMYSKKLSVAAIEVQAGGLSEPNTTIGVVDYVAKISKIAYPTKVIFYDKRKDPMSFNMAKLFPLAREIPNFVGIKTSLSSCLTILSHNQLNQNLITWSYTSYDLPGAYAYCINGTSTQIANIFPGWSVQIKNYIQNGQYNAAVTLQEKMSKATGACFDLLSADKEDASSYAYAEQVLRYMMKLVNGIDVGFARYPYPQISSKIQRQCASRLRAQGII